MEYRLKEINIQEACGIANTKDALVIMGCSGDLTHWIIGINDTLIKKNILKEPMNELCLLINKDKRRDLIFMFNDTLETGKLCIWRLKEGITYNAKWLSDYIDNNYFYE